MSEIETYDEVLALFGKTVVGIDVKPYRLGLGGAMESVRLTCSDGTSVVLSAGEYCIPESCIYAELFTPGA